MKDDLRERQIELNNYREQILDMQRHTLPMPMWIVYCYSCGHGHLANYINCKVKNGNTKE